MDAKKSAPRYAPKSEWSTLPIQPPAGSWQQRTTRLFPAFAATLVLVFLFAFTTHTGSPAFVLFQISMAGLMLECAFYIVAGVRGTLLERRERKLGYSTWARKR